MGQRANFEEAYSGDTLQGNYVAGVYYPDKTQTQRIGIKIDIPVNKTIAAVRNCEDEILDKALQYIQNQK